MVLVASRELLEGKDQEATFTPASPLLSSRPLVSLRGRWRRETRGSEGCGSTAPADVFRRPEHGVTSPHRRDGAVLAGGSGYPGAWHRDGVDAISTKSREQQSSVFYRFSTLGSKVPDSLPKISPFRRGSDSRNLHPSRLRSVSPASPSGNDRLAPRAGSTERMRAAWARGRTYNKGLMRHS